jgi:hypothetical protein
VPTEEEFEELSSKVEKLWRTVDQLNVRTPRAGADMPDGGMNPPVDPCPPKQQSFMWAGGRQCSAPPVEVSMTVKIGGSPDAPGASDDAMTRIAKLSEG